jgi:hypothetical protein
MISIITPPQAKWGYAEKKLFLFGVSRKQKILISVLLLAKEKRGGEFDLMKKRKKINIWMLYGLDKVTTYFFFFLKYVMRE